MTVVAKRLFIRSAMVMIMMSSYCKIRLSACFPTKYISNDVGYLLSFLALLNCVQYANSHFLRKMLFLSLSIE